MPRHVGPKTRLFVSAYCDPGPAQFKAIQSAALAGYRFPHLTGPRLVSKHKELIDQRLAELIAGPQEVLMICSGIARDTQAAESSRLKAAELMIRVHGLIGSDITVNLNRQALEAEILAEARRLLPAADDRRRGGRALQASTVDAAVVESVAADIPDRDSPAGEVETGAPPGGANQAERHAEEPAIDDSGAEAITGD